ncbi:uncharacterized protein LOC114527664 [Dendronephthya gigantea]|uniref:uncharacterized protein LOC114527664 n=1 Tax=Dendronephthya gigantea TaxID=151771 RepID=UPI00106BA594|nr:uncharacterized protein LOC114527664 [Dendronephthya gigantea]
MKWIACFFYLTLRSVHTEGFNGTQDNAVSIIFVGDVSFGSCIMYYVNHGYNYYNDTLVKVAGPIKNADIAVGNLESPYVTKTMMKDSYKGRKNVYINAHPDSAAALRLAGFDIMSLANNHLNDFGEKPVNYTMKALADVGIKSFGTNFGEYDTPQRSVILEKKGVKIGFLGYCDVYFRTRDSCSKIRKTYDAGPAIYSNRIAERDVQHLKGQGVDVVLVYMHWGREYRLRPNRRQKRIAEYLHSLGVSAVIGAHSHTLQPHSKTKNQLTVYSLGNFLFPQHRTRFWIFRAKHARKVMRLTKKRIAEFERKASTQVGPTTFSRILRLRVTRKGVESASYLPVQIKFDPTHKTLQPTLTNGTHWIEVCSPEDKECSRMNDTRRKGKNLHL